MERVICEYEGKWYERKPSGWVKEGHWELVDGRLQRILNRKYIRHELAKAYNFENLWTLSGKYCDQEDYSNAIWCLEKIAEKESDKKKLSQILSRLSACYRKTKRHDDVIALYEWASHSGLYLDESFCTSLGAAYFDLYEKDGNIAFLETAKKFLDKAYGKSKGRPDTSLKNAYARYNSIAHDRW